MAPSLPSAPGSPMGVERLTASAGSGKTHRLALRFLGLLLAPNVPDTDLSRILAVTFTNKAAGEMRERVLSWLEALALQRAPQDVEIVQNLSSWLGQSPEALRAAAREVLDRIYRRWPELSLKTIDSYLMTLARASAFELGLAPGARVLLDPRPLLRRAVGRLLEEAEDDPPSAEVLRTVLEDLLLGDESLGWDLAEVLVEIDARLRTLWVSKLKKLQVDPAGFRAYHHELEGSLAAGRDLLDAVGKAGLEFRGGTFQRDLCRFLDTRQPEVLKSAAFFKPSLKEAVLKSRAGAVTPTLEGLFNAFREALARAAEAWALGRTAPQVQLHARLIPALEREAAREGALLLDEVPSRIAARLSEGGVPSIYLALGDHLRHFLLDEFQDTGAAQWAALLPLVEEGLASGGSLFYVGDQKQSLYRFRGGDPDLFDRALEDLSAFETRREVLRRNFRSRAVLVDFFNRTFSREALERWFFSLGDSPEEEEDLRREDFERRIWPFFKEARQEPSPKREGGRVGVIPIALDPGLSREEAVAAAAEEAAGRILPDLLGRGYSPSDVAFLLRTNREAVAVGEALQRRGYRVASESTARMTSHPLVREVLDLLRFVTSPADDLAFASFAGGRIMESVSGVSRDDFLALLHTRPPGSRGNLYAWYREAFPEPWLRLVNPAFQSAGYLPPYDLVRDFFERAGVLEAFPEDRAFLLHLLERLAEREGEGEATAADFLAYLQESEEDPALQVPLPESGDAVRVLTVHKSKGLGFPVVVLLLPNLSPPAIREAVLEEGPTLRLLRLSAWGCRFSPVLRRARDQEKVLALRDELNAYYVAVTRAKDELYVILESNRSRQKPVPLPAEVGGEGYAAGEAVPFEGDRPGGALPCPGPSRRVPWRPRMGPAGDPAYRPPTTESVAAARRGKILHAGLEAGLRGRPGDEAAFEGLGASAEEAREMAGLLRRLAGHPHIGPLIAPEDAEVLDEVEFLDPEGRFLRVDRLIRDRDGFTVVDWKSGEEERPGQHEQVARYCRLLARLHPGERVRGVLVYLAGGRAEDVAW
ncbi:MAG: UvrD-helicase domain-containing protein [Acidobacteriota bacterium]